MSFDNISFLRDNHTPARGIPDMCTGQGLAQDLVPVRGRYTYSGGRGMGCDYKIIVHLKFSHFPLKMASFNCKFSRNSTEVAKWVIVILCGPRACTRSCARPRAAQDLVPPSKRQLAKPPPPPQPLQRCSVVSFVERAPYCCLGKSPKCAG